LFQKFILSKNDREFFADILLGEVKQWMEIEDDWAHRENPALPMQGRCC
jgi:hypothetical protein